MPRCTEGARDGNAGARPAFDDPRYAGFGEMVLVTTCGAPEDNGFVLAVVDITGPLPPPGTIYGAEIYHHETWTRRFLGDVFGLTLDSSGNIYAAATTIYFVRFGAPIPDPGAVYRIDHKTAMITKFVSLPNKGPALGNINYDCTHDSFYVSNHDDGRIYQVDPSGRILSSYDHATASVRFGPGTEPGEPDGVFVPLGERVWAVQSHRGRLYYSVWQQDRTRPGPPNQIWSVALQPNGVLDPATKTLEISSPPLGFYSSPVSDISFGPEQLMMAVERTMEGDTFSKSHVARALEWQEDGSGIWAPSSRSFAIGWEVSDTNAAGGVDYEHERGNGPLHVWFTGDQVAPQVYGLQGTPQTGGAGADSTLIDLGTSKAYLGDVEIPVGGAALPPDDDPTTGPEPPTD